MRLQAIDIGTNSVRSIIVDVPDVGEVRPVDDEKESTRLGDGLGATGAMAPGPMQHTVDALRVFLGIGRDLGVDRVRAIATAAMRTASNGQQFRQRLLDELGLDVEIISEEAEGRLVFLSAASQFPLTGHSAVVDIGGGSVEIVTAEGGEIARIASVPLGSRVTTERFVDSDPVGDSGFKAMKKHVRATLMAALGESVTGVGTLVGSGGTVTSVGAMTAAMAGRKVDSSHGREVTRPAVMQLLSELSRSTADQRRKMAGLPQERADVILAGVLVLAEVMKLTGASSVFVNGRGIRGGLIIDTVREATDGTRLDRRAAIGAFGERCGYDARHAEQVERIALSLFDQMECDLALDRSQRELLQAAALLHDVGYHIAYDRHHRHSHHLIMHSGLPGFTDSDLRRVAAIARYHTKALPKSQHEAWSMLDQDERDAVAPLAAILRIADALDRGRAGRLDDVSVAVHEGVVTLAVRGAGDLHPETYAVEKKKDLFERHFGHEVEVVVIPIRDG